MKYLCDANIPESDIRILAELRVSLELGEQENTKKCLQELGKYGETSKEIANYFIDHLKECSRCQHVYNTKATVISSFSGIIKTIQMAENDSSIQRIDIDKGLGMGFNEKRK